MNAKMICRVMCLVSLPCLVFISSAHAGTLDPRLAALSATNSPAGRTAVTRSVVHSQTHPLDPFAPRIDAAGSVQVYVFPVSRNAALPSASEIAALGGSKIVTSTLLHVVQAWVPVSALKTLAALPDVGRVRVPDYAVILQAVERPAPESTETGGSSHTITRGVPSGLTIDGDAVQAMQANQLQIVNAAGTGIKVGVMSLDNSGYTASEAAGYLPAGVPCVANSDCSTPNTSDPNGVAEGTAMLEEVHAMAPNAQLDFCGPDTTVDFVDCYNALIAWGANVIVDDLGFNNVDMFTIGQSDDGSFAHSISQITQANPSVAFVSSAGNDAQDYYNELYTAGPACTIGGVNYSSCMDFGEASGGASSDELKVTIKTTSAFAPTMQWNDPLGTSPDQFVLYLVNGSGTVLKTSLSAITSDKRAGVSLSYTPATVGETDYLEVGCQSCINPVWLKIMGWGDGPVQFGTPTEGSVDPGQKVAAGVLATAAAGVTSQSPLAVNLEPFSAIGPFWYGDYGAVTTLAKPDLTGVDCVVVSGAGGFSASLPATGGGVYFTGTSATSPNVGALIADLMSADPGKPASFYYSALENTANQTSFGTTPYTRCEAIGNNFIPGYETANAGAGLAQGFAALQSFFTFPSTSITAPVSVVSGASGSYTVPINAAIDFTAAVQSGTNSASASGCEWNAGGTMQTGVTVAYTFPSAGAYKVSVNCPDSQGIVNPASPPVLNVTAEGIPTPTVAVSATSNTSLYVTLTGAEPLTLAATSSNTAVLPSSGVTFSSGCGSTTLSCIVTLSPVAQANGDTTITITATDPYGQQGNGTEQISYTFPPPTVALSTTSSTSLNLTLTGAEPLTLTATSSNTAVLPNSGITFSSGCGSTTLSCSVSLAPAAQANGSTTITITATDPYGRQASGAASASYSYTAPSQKSGGGGSVAWLTLLFLGLAAAIRRRRA